jgi:hypothetical protein
MDENRTLLAAPASPAEFLRWAGVFFKSPRRAYAELALEGGYGVPALYILFWSAVSAVVQFLIGLLPGRSPATIGTALLGVVLALVFSFAVAGILFVIWHLMGSKKDYQAAFRCWSLMAPLSLAGALLGAVPYLSILPSLYAFYPLVAASIESHRLSSERSWAVWISIAVVLTISVVLLVAVGLALQSQGGLKPQ